MIPVQTAGTKTRIWSGFFKQEVAVRPPPRHCRSGGAAAVALLSQESTAGVQGSTFRFLCKGTPSRVGMASGRDQRASTLLNKGKFLSFSRLVTSLPQLSSLLGLLPVAFLSASGFSHSFSSRGRMHPCKLLWAETGGWGVGERLIAKANRAFCGKHAPQGAI